MTAADHPSEILLRAFVRGLLAPDDASPIESHVTACLECAGRLDDLSDDDPLQDRLRIVDDIEPIHAPSDRMITTGAGEQVGPYQLIERLGEGGMGEVWRAEQREPVRRTVALKLIRPELAGRRILGRFEAERQTLALMDHPHIARVLDAGATRDGRPYFVMELVRGEPISAYCDRMNLAPDRRIELFVPVCRAVQHAHQKGIIHRDLKPSNILVALQDGQPVPKVIDFGIAKATGDPLNDRSLATELGQAIGTPGYMAPEQTGLDDLDVDTRADVYALGVVLYELLAGSPPFLTKQLHGAALLEVLRVIREDEPPKPSTRLSSSDELPSIAARRQLDPARLTKLIRGDLDWVVMKCLEKDRARRYATADQLAADLQRYLAHEPVEAGPPSRRYQLGKFVRRHRTGVIATTALILALVVGIVGTTWGLVRAVKAERAALLASQAERARRGQLETANTILTSVFDDLDPRGEEKAGRPLRAILGDRLDDAARQLEQGVGDPQTQIRLIDSLGSAFRNLGDASRAVAMFRKEVAISTEELGADDPITLTARSNLASAMEAAGQVREAMQLNEEILRVREQKLGADHPDTLISRGLLASTYQNLGRTTEAIALQREILKIRAARLGPNHADTILARNNLATTLYSMAQYDEAARLFEANLAARETLLGPDHPATAQARSNLAAVYTEMGRATDSVRLHEQALQARVAKLGNDHPDTLISRANLAGAYLKLKRAGDAVPLYEAVLRARESKLGVNHPDTLSSRSYLAAAYLDLDRPADAARVLEVAVDRLSTQVGPANEKTLAARHNLAYAELNLGENAAAVRRFEENLRLAEEALGPDHPSTMTFRRALAEALFKISQPEQATALRLRDVERKRIQVGGDTARFGGELMGTAIDLVAKKQFAAAETLFRECLALRARSSPDRWKVLSTKSALGDVLLVQSRTTEAEPLLLDAFQGLKAEAASLPPEARPRIPEARDRLARLYDATDRPADAARIRAEPLPTMP